MDNINIMDLSLLLEALDESDVEKVIYKEKDSSYDDIKEKEEEINRERLRIKHDKITYITTIFQHVNHILHDVIILPYPDLSIIELDLTTIEYQNLEYDNTSILGQYMVSNRKIIKELVVESFNIIKDEWKYNIEENNSNINTITNIKQNEFMKSLYHRIYNKDKNHEWVTSFIKEEYNLSTDSSYKKKNKSSSTKNPVVIIKENVTFLLKNGWNEYKKVQKNLYYRIYIFFWTEQLMTFKMLSDFFRLLFFIYSHSSLLLSSKLKTINTEYLIENNNFKSDYWVGSNKEEEIVGDTLRDWLTLEEEKDKSIQSEISLNNNVHLKNMKLKEKLELYYFKSIEEWSIFYNRQFSSFILFNNDNDNEIKVENKNNKLYYSLFDIIEFLNKIKQIIKTNIVYENPYNIEKYDKPNRFIQIYSETNSSYSIKKTGIKEIITPSLKILSKYNEKEGHEIDSLKSLLIIFKNSPIITNIKVLNILKFSLQHLMLFIRSHIHRNLILSKSTLGEYNTIIIGPEINIEKISYYGDILKYIISILEDYTLILKKKENEENEFIKKKNINFAFKWCEVTLELIMKLNENSFFFNNTGFTEDAKETITMYDNLLVSWLITMSSPSSSSQ